MSRRHVAIKVINRHCAHVRGHGSYAALVAITGCKPVRSNTAGAWVVSERTALLRLLPYLEHLGYDVTVTGPRSSAVPPMSEPSEPSEAEDIAAAGQQALPW